MRRTPALLAVCGLAAACSSGGGAAPADVAPETDTAAPLTFTVVQFNTGTSENIATGEGGYTTALAKLSDEWYGDGLAWTPAVDAVRAFLAATKPDVVTFQEVFHPGDCEGIPAEARKGFYCETHAPAGPTVAQAVLGEGFQVACNLGKPDKCAGIRKSFGTFRGCASDLCMDGLWGSTVDGCGKGARIGRAVVDLVAGGSLTLVNVHASSGFLPDDQQCRVRQFDQLFTDLGDGKPAASGERNLVMGDFNTDPGQLAGTDPSATRLVESVGEGKRFRFLTDAGPDATPTYGGLANIDHVISDAFEGDCVHPGVTPGAAPVLATPYFDHRPAVCTLHAAGPTGGNP
jgi:endonuclease/exonuclease/phosphatase family metal-dependent hydrolase